MEKAFEITDEIMEKINRYAVEPLSAKDVYCFSVTLCDNDIDRDGERFSVDALGELAKLFLGKTGIFDHDPKGEKQTARIFDTCVKQDSEKLTKDGQPYVSLCAKAYMVRTSGNADLIKEISGGIKKEVSVSCAVKKRICSICGADRNVSSCSHIAGRRYGEKLCFTVLQQPADAYEWSFVAVPAQVNAGVTKHYDAHREESRQVSKLKGELSAASAKLAAAYDVIRGEVLKLSYFCEPFIAAKQVAEMTEGMDLHRLIELKNSLEKQVRDNAQRLDADEQSFITQPPQADENEEYTI
ncbi:MAG: hypothetical protein II574_04590 [Ruminococcus sp.]|nr:hypothetical protein [Ruminococcus sp.]